MSAQTPNGGQCTPQVTALAKKGISKRVIAKRLKISRIFD
jgi:hypothetical protein